MYVIISNGEKNRHAVKYSQLNHLHLPLAKRTTDARHKGIKTGINGKSSGLTIDSAQQKNVQACYPLHTNQTVLLKMSHYANRSFIQTN